MVTYRFHQYQVVGRALPSDTDEHPKIYRMKLWATNEVRAKSKFWYFLRKLKKVKKSNGQMLAINELCVYELLFKETISWCLMCFLGNENLDMWERLDPTSFRFLAS
ncbi:hypothetical protein C3L33_06078, partial [Rhododendron williamsianum]